MAPCCQKMFNKPILFLIFNRPETTKLVFEEIRKLKPKYLFIAADGPRTDHPNDLENCKESRNIVKSIDWDCNVKTLFRDKNLGCGLAPAEAITWFFDHVEEGIILEDDCLPNQSFFTFCEALLEKHRTNPKIMMICGTSYQTIPLDTNTYYYSKYAHVWGWATWKRAWSLYNFNLTNEVESERYRVIKKTFSNKRERKLWIYNLKLIDSKLDAWDYQWMYWIWKHEGLSIVPWQNMISNIGFGPKATHTLSVNSDQSRMHQHEIINIVHPKGIEYNIKADKYERYNILISPLIKYVAIKITAKMKRILKWL